MVLGQRLLPGRKCSECTRQAEWGCESNAFLPSTFDGQELWRCPLRLFKEDPHGVNDVLMAYWFYRDGHFPESGTWMDQSARLLKFFQIITVAHKDADETEKEQRERAQARNTRPRK